MAPPRFRPTRLDDVEHVEDYRPGGFHPLAIGDTLGESRYKIVHKLGFGGSSTIWLARNPAGKLVTLKIMRADLSSKPADTELVVPLKLSEYIAAENHPARTNIQTLEDHFVEHGPNGAHLCLVSQFAGPSILSLYDSPGRVIGNRRLRKGLAQKVAKQVVSAVDLMHTAGFVHGDITTSNILFRCAEQVRNWSDSEVYLHFGDPVTEDVATFDGSPPGPHAPEQLVEPIANICWSDSALLQEDVVLIDFGQSFSASQPPENYEPATVANYQSPEASFEGRISAASDIWALGCVIFEIRAGYPLFEAFLGGDEEVLKEVVATRGKLPEPWWQAFENRFKWFDEEGNPKAVQDVMLPARKTSIQQKLGDVGLQDEPPTTGDDGPMMERPGTKLETTEIQLLGELLEKMLRYLPEERIRASEVISHPWFLSNYVGDLGD